MFNMDKPQGIIHFDDVLQNSVCLLINRAIKMCFSDLDIHIPKQIGRKNSKPSINTSPNLSLIFIFQNKSGEKILNHPSIHHPTSPAENKSDSIFWAIFPTNVWRTFNICLSCSCCLSIFLHYPLVGPKWHECRFFHGHSYLNYILSCSKICFIVVHNMFIHNMFNHICNMFHYLYNMLYHVNNMFYHVHNMFYHIVTRACSITFITCCIMFIICMYVVSCL